MKAFLTSILLLFWINGYSQLVNDSTIQKLHKQLEETGISQVIKYRNFVKQKGIYRIQFDFRSDDAAKNNQLWQMLKNDFYKEKNIDIRQYLYFYCINIFKIEQPENVLLEIRQSYINEDCPFIQYYYNEKTKQYLGDEKICMAEYSDNVSFDALEFFDKKTIRKKPSKTRNAYYNMLNSHFRELYSKGGFRKHSKEAKFSSSYRKGDAILKFEVKDLQKEVLTHAGENFVYRILRYFYDEPLLPYEYIKVEISLELNKSNNQMAMKIKVVGGYGSGFYQNKDKHTMNDLDKGFPAYINDYAEEVSNEVVRKITQYKNFKR